MVNIHRKCTIFDSKHISDLKGQLFALNIYILSTEKKVDESMLISVIAFEEVHYIFEG